MKSPYPYFGGKATVAAEIWKRLGDVGSYVEPFFGSGAVLLSRPHKIERQVETVNDLDGMISNFWRAIAKDPEAVAKYADWPVNECDLHARHLWLLGQKEGLADRLSGAPAYFDAKIAGWWVWGISCWIGRGWCSGGGPWVARDGVLVKSDKGDGVWKVRPHLGNNGQGVNRQLPHLGTKGNGVNRQATNLIAYFQALSDRLRSVRVCCGDWSRVCGPSVIEHGSTFGIVLDPPYAVEDRQDVYVEESRTLAKEVRDWAVEHGKDRHYRIALCGYEGEHEIPGDWSTFEWKAKGGYESQSDDRTGNCRRERIWFSPGCAKPVRSMQLNLF